MRNKFELQDYEAVTPAPNRRRFCLSDIENDSQAIHTVADGYSPNTFQSPSIDAAKLKNMAKSADSRYGWAVGSGGAIYRTVNGGLSWQSQTSGVVVDLLDVKFIDTAEGWAVGDEGTLLDTNDGGMHWMSEHSPTPHSLERIFFTDRSHGWAVGFGGTIIAYSSLSGRFKAPKLQR